MKIGIYGGTFNPIHLGHMEAAKSAMERLGLDRLLLVPVGTPPHKALWEGAAGHHHRLEMARLAAEAMELGDRVAVSDLELNREGSSYTVDTMEQLHERYSQDQLYLLMGTDMFLSFQNWYQPQRIAQLCTLCAFHREPGEDGDAFRRQKQSLETAFGARVELLELPQVVDISSTQLRASLARGEGREFLAPTVYGYILREGLYGVKRDLRQLSLEDLRCVALTLLKHSRIPHVLGTEETAAALARRWGGDEEEARRAALLHDCTKNLNMEQQMTLCRQYGIELDDVERGEVKLLHAHTGAAVADHIFGVSPAIRDAIRWHTTGKADMTLLEKILYLADYIEPNRNFCDLTQLRSLAFQDLDQAMLLAFTMAVEDMQAQGTPVHPNSVYARDYMQETLGKGKPT